jgi:stage II sporulation protein D
MSRRKTTVLLALSCAAAVVAGSAPIGGFGGSGSAGLASAGQHQLAGAQAVAASCPSAGGVKVAEAAAPTGVVKVYGHGWGHGMGMSQYGAQGAARLGCSYRTILDTYYHDASVAKRTLSANVLLKLAGGATRSTLDAVTGPVKWAAASRSAVQPKGSTWWVTRKTVSGQVGLALIDAAGERRLFVPNAVTLSAEHSGVVVNVHARGSSSGLVTRWDTARFIGSPSGIAVTEVISAGHGYTAVQKYLMGLGEVPVSWPIEALKAQVVAARTYLTSKYSSTTNVYAVTTTTSDQVYAGYTQEKKDAALGGHWHKAVVDTLGQVIVDPNGKIIEAMYSSSAGGYTENRQYVYGRYGISYLKAVDDSRWDNASDNPYRRWSKGFSKAGLAKAFGFTSVTSWTVAKRGTAARLNGVRITGKRAGKTVTVAFTGTQARSKLGLKSPGFTFGPIPTKPTTPITPPPTPTPTPTPSPTLTSTLTGLRNPTPKSPHTR